MSNCRNVRAIGDPKQQNERPGWRMSNAQPATGDLIARTLQGEPSAPQHPALRTQFRGALNRMERWARRAGLKTVRKSEVTVSHDVITISDQEERSLAGLNLTFRKSEGAIVMHHIMQATNDGKDVTLLLTKGQVTISNLCRPVTFSQCVNRMLASAEPPPQRNCANCRHYRRWPVEGNRGECAIGADEPDPECGLRGNDHWCPAHEIRTTDAVGNE